MHRQLSGALIPPKKPSGDWTQTSVVNPPRMETDAKPSTRQIPDQDTNMLRTPANSFRMTDARAYIRGHLGGVYGKTVWESN